jgi:hypothetical protein
VAAGFAVVAWSGIEQWGDSGGDDSFAYGDYVGRLDRTHQLPPRTENYEFSLPPGVPAIGLAVAIAARPIIPDRPSPPFQALPRLLRRLLWLVLACGGATLLATSRPRQPRWLVGIAATTFAFGIAASYVYTAVNNERWLPTVLVSYVSSVALVPMTALLAGEALPEQRWAPSLGALGAALLPPIFAATLYFHPDPPFALASITATWVVLRAFRTGLTFGAGIAAGAALGAAAWMRQSSPVVALALGLSVALAARKGSVRFLAGAAGALLAVAGPWWVIQTVRFGNPLLSNLSRPGQMLNHEPLSFFVSAPTELVMHPYIPSFQNELLPRFHAYLWSDWGGGYHHWGATKHFATFFASTQSVLGFGGDALVVGGVVLLGGPAVRQLARRAGRSGDAALATLAVLFVSSWAAYVTELVRFPQKSGDPIKAHYLLFLAPVSVVFAAAAGTALVRRGGWWRAVMLAWLAAYAISWAMTLATAF